MTQHHASEEACEQLSCVTGSRRITGSGRTEGISTAHNACVGVFGTFAIAPAPTPFTHYGVCTAAAGAGIQYDSPATTRSGLRFSEGLLLMIASRASCVSLPSNSIARVVTVSPERAVYRSVRGEPARIT